MLSSNTTTTTTRGTSGNIFSDLTGIINSNPTSTSPSSHNACNNRLNAVPSNQGIYHNISSNNSITQLSSPLSAVHTSIQTVSQSIPTTMTADNSQHCQPKSGLLINHKNHDDVDVGSGKDSSLAHKKDERDPSHKHQKHISSNIETNDSRFESLYQNNHENGLITIVTVNSLSGSGENNSVV